MSDCYIAGLQIDSSASEGAGIYVDLPGGITLQKSTLEEAVKAYGEPVDGFEGEKEVLLTYEYGMYLSLIHIWRATRWTRSSRSSRTAIGR